MGHERVELTLPSHGAAFTYQRGDEVNVEFSKALRRYFFKSFRKGNHF